MRQRDRRERRDPAPASSKSSSKASSEEQREGGGAAGLPALMSGAPVSPGTVLALQRAIGNAAVAKLVGQVRQPEVPWPVVQRSAVPQVLGSPGKPLTDSVRGEMEARLGADLADVRVHDGPTAARSAAELGARAYTSGNHVVVGEGGADMHTLAHELTHVIQQRSGPVAGTRSSDGLKVSDPTDRFERAAEVNAHRVMAGPVPHRDVESEAGSGASARGGGGSADIQRALMVDGKTYTEYADLKVWLEDEDYAAEPKASTEEPEALSKEEVVDEPESAAPAVPSTFAAADALKEEIITRYIKSGTNFDFSTQSLINDLMMRLTLITFMGWVNSKHSPYTYNFDSDTWTMPESWKGTAAQEEEEDEGKGKKKSEPKVHKPDAGVAFVPVGESFDAVMDMFDRTGEDGMFYADCSTTIIALHYFALARVLGRKKFSTKYQGRTALAPAGVQADIGGKFTQLPILDEDDGDIELVPNKNIKSVEMLVPGDWVYFESYSDYAETHEGAAAAWAGEHALYLGNSVFQGFGTARVTYDEMVAKLKKYYNVQGKKAKAKVKSQPEESKNAIGGYLPGITEVRRLKQQD